MATLTRAVTIPWKKKTKYKLEYFYIYGIIFLIVLLINGILSLFDKAVIPFGIFDFWKFNFSWSDVFSSSWPVLTWGVAHALFIAAVTRYDSEGLSHAEDDLKEGLKTSFQAGFFEELAFRWFRFYIALFTVTVIGIITFGLWEWICTNGFIPLADWATQRHMTEILYNNGWIVGAAVLTSNGKFRNGHAYQGPIGVVNSWFVGMLMFFLIFQYGILAAIVMHILYDVILDLVLYVDKLAERYNLSLLFSIVAIPSVIIALGFALSTVTGISFITATIVITVLIGLVIWLIHQSLKYKSLRSSSR